MHAWPFATVSGPKATGPDLADLVGLLRSGTAFEFLNNTDGGTVSQCFSGHYNVGFRAANLNGLRFDHCGAESPYNADATGYTFEGAAQNIELTACQGVGCQNGVVVNLSGLSNLISINGGMYASNSDNNVRVFNGTVAVRNANLGFAQIKDGHIVTAAHVSIIGTRSQIILQNNNFKTGIQLVELLEGATNRQILDMTGNVPLNPSMYEMAPP